MIVSFTHDCGCVFTRSPDSATFYQSHSCVKHEDIAARQVPYINPYIAVADGGLPRQTPFGELLCADEFD